MKRTIKAISSVLFPMTLMHNVWADVPSLPASVNPGVVSQTLMNQQPSYPTAPLRAIAPPKQAQSALTEQAKKITFKLKGVILTGNHVYSTAQLSVFYKQDLNKTITVAEVFKIAQGITDYYRNNGYILSRAFIPTQQVTTGIVRIQIVEGYISHVTVEGKAYRACPLIQGMGDRIKQCPPLQLSRMEKYLLLLNEIPHTLVKAVLGPAKIEQGASELKLVTVVDPVTGYVSEDNYGTRYLGPQELTGSISLNSLIGPGDSLTYTTTRTPKGIELRYNDLNYSTALDTNGTRMQIGDTNDVTVPLYFLAPEKIEGINNNIYFNLSFPYIRTQSESFTWRLAFNYQDVWTTTFDENLYTDHLRPLDLGFSWSFADAYQGSNNFIVDLREGLPIFGWTSDDNLNAQTSRPGADGKFTKFTIQANRLQQVWKTWSLYGAFQGQYSFEPLLTEEQFAYGGSQMGRGYDPAEIIGDRGMGGTLELRYDHEFSRLLHTVEFYAFYDGGIVWNYKQVGGVPREIGATSAGGGARFYFTKYVSGNLMWAQPLTQKVAADALDGNGWRPRVFFSVVVTSF